MISSSVAEMVPISLKKRGKILRARLAELFGSERYCWPAINNLDRLVVEELPADGTFLEVGANDGYAQSNTYYLERRMGWRGILVEPLPGLARQARKTRPNSFVYNYACVEPEKAGNPMTVVDLDLMSVSLGQQGESKEAARISRAHVKRGRQVSVSTTTISELIGRSGLRDLTFMSVDVEGAEVGLLKGLDFGRHCPQFLLVETKEFDEVQTLVDPWMRFRKSLSHHDYLFERA